MHDLRMSPSRQYQLVIGDEGGGDADPPASGVVYFRRGVRSNEIFFTYDRDRFSEMLRAFLEGWRARATP